MATNTSDEAADSTRRTVFIVVALVTALIVAALVYWATRPRPAATEQPRLENALRAGAPEFAQARERVVIDFIPDQDAFESPRPAGDIVMTLRPKIRNFTGRTINGLELQATVVDLQGNPVRQRTVIAIPGPVTNTTELEPNKVAQAQIIMEGFKKTDVRANIRPIEVTAVRFKQ